MKKKYFWLLAAVLLAGSLALQCGNGGGGPNILDDPDDKAPVAPPDNYFGGGTLKGGNRAREAIVPAGYFAQWAPGIPDGISNYTNIHTTIDAKTYGNGATDATQAIQAALDAAGAAASAENPQVVLLPAGTYNVDGKLIINKSYVVLRGTGPGTVIRGHITGSLGGAIVIGTESPDFENTTIVNVTGNVNVGATSITVQDAGSFKPGDILMIDRRADDGNDPRGTTLTGSEWPQNYFHVRGGVYDAIQEPSGNVNLIGRYHPNNGPTVSPDGLRSIRQYIEVAGVSGSTLNLVNRINIAFPQTGANSKSLSPQVWKVGNTITRYSGIEHLKVQNVTTTYAHTPGIVLQFDSSCCWVKNVESDGTLSRTVPALEGPRSANFFGVHIRVKGFRNHVTGNYVHDSYQNTNGGYGYGIEIHGTDCLIDNNIIDNLMKPVLGYATGGGNVIAYNYVPNATSEDDPTWQETGLDTAHASYCHSDLYEGNYAVNLSTDSTFGNNGWMVYYRNYAWGYNLKDVRTGPLNAVGIHGWNNEHASIGNVYLDPKDVASGKVKGNRDTPASTMAWELVAYRVGTQAGSQGGNSTEVGPMGPLDRLSPDYDGYTANPQGWAWSRFHRHLDFNAYADAFGDGLYNNTDNPVKILEQSLFLSSPPGYFGGYAWPPVDPTKASHETRVSGLPAKARYDSKNYTYAF